MKLSSIIIFTIADNEDHIHNVCRSPGIIKVLKIIMVNGFKSIKGPSGIIVKVQTVIRSHGFVSCQQDIYDCRGDF